MKKQTKTHIYNFLSFGAAFLIFRLFFHYVNTSFSNWQIPVASAVLATLVAPKFHFLNTAQGGKIFMSWFFSKKTKEIK